MLLLEGQPPAQAILNRLKEATACLDATKSKPTVAFVLVGEDPPSQAYVARKKSTAETVGFESRVIQLAENTSTAELLKVIQGLNEDPAIHGILVQSPLPKAIEPLTIFNAIDPKKDVDGFHAFNMGRLVQGGKDAFMPCTPWGIGELLKYYNIQTNGKHVVVVGRSLIVGRPAALLLVEREWNATVTLAHTGTTNLEGLMQQADILIIATGKPQWVKAQHVAPKAVVIDVGINRIVDPEIPSGYRLVGDVDFDDVSKKASAITPVPGGIGPMTVAGLMANTWKAYSL